MRRSFTLYFLPLIITIMSIFVLALLDTDMLNAFIGYYFDNDKADNTKRIIRFLSYVLLVIPLAYQSITRGKKAFLCDTIITKFMEQQRELISTILQDKNLVDCTIENINIRIFKKRFNRLVLENNEEFNSNMIKGSLSFSISNEEGLCVKAYLEKRSMLEIEDASKAEYNLTKRQKILAGNLKFIVAVPIIIDGKDKVKYVICFDSFQKIAKSAKSGYEDEILRQCETIAYDIVRIIE